MEKAKHIVVITGSPRRVVSLSPAMTASLIELGFAGRLAGVSDSCILPDALGEIERCGSALLPDTAAILALQPDLVVASTDLPAALTGPLQEAGIPLLVIRRAADLDGLRYERRAQHAGSDECGQHEHLHRHLRAV